MFSEGLHRAPCNVESRGYLRGFAVVEVYFPGTSDGAAFFENNDQMLLARVDKTKILDRSAYQSAPRTCVFLILGFFK